MSEPIYDAIGNFMRVVTDQVKALREENRSLSAQVVELRGLLDATVTRGAPEPVPGPAGADGVGIAAIRGDGAELVVALSSGTEQRFALPAGPQGERGEQGPQGERGQDGPQGESGPSGERGERGEPGERGADGVGIAQARIFGGELLLRMTDGTEANLGRVVGEPGPAGVPGERGADGASGITREEFELAIAAAEERGEERGARLALVRTIADTYRGVWKAGEYQRGDTATWQGTLYLAVTDNAKQPDTSPQDWKPIAHKGRDGKDRR